jgi:tryptophan synthase alpha chain
MADAGGDRIAAAFAAARADGRAALMPYLVGGYPDHDLSLAVAEAYAEGGADLIELGVPFSDPLADGPVIHAAATEALRGGATLESVLDICASVADRLPVLLMVYANMVLARGPEEFAEAAVAAGAAGAIVPDLSFEEAAGFRGVFDLAGLALAPLVAPTTPPERRRRICDAARGFVYVVSLVGVTGERGELPAELEELVAAVREEATVPAAVGFGIGTPEQAAAVGEVADGVIIGSRLVRAVADADAGGAGAATRDFLRACRAAMSGQRAVG